MTQPRMLLPVEVLSPHLGAARLSRRLDDRRVPYRELMLPGGEQRTMHKRGISRDHWQTAQRLDRVDGGSVGKGGTEFAGGAQ